MWYSVFRTSLATSLDDDSVLHRGSAGQLAESTRLTLSIKLQEPQISAVVHGAESDCTFRRKEINGNDGSVIQILCYNIQLEWRFLC